ncbi:hypothetical protein L7F22_065392 [Adiantum nelumboides]|nr:hypothetical protein [Adiantum nelumboides]
MHQPEDFFIPSKEHLVCKLKRSLYGLKQAPKQWFKKLDIFMLNHGLKRSHANHYLYTKKALDGSLIELVLYVDDMLTTSKHNKTLNALKKELNSAFSMRNLGPAKHISDVRITLNALKKELNSTFSMKDLGPAEHISDMRITRDRKKSLLLLSQDKTDDVTEEVFSSEGRQVHEEGESSRPPQFIPLPDIGDAESKIFGISTTTSSYSASWVTVALEKTQAEQKKAADRHRREVVFSLGDWVLLRFEKERLKKMKGKERLFPKLSMRYYGPFQVCNIISDVAYRLKLPESWKSHNAFHASLLRPYVGDVSEDMPTEDQPEVEELDEILVPEQISAHKERKVKGKVARLYLVKFKNYPPIDAKWMEEGELAESTTVLSLLP